jgi:hypothetical protein
MSTTYTYSIAEDFGGSLDDHAFWREVIYSSISSATLEKINVDRGTDSCLVVYNQALSGADETTLDGLVAAHVCADARCFLKYEADEDQDTTTSTSWQQKLLLDCENGYLDTHYYSLHWYIEFKLNNGALGDVAEIMLSSDGTEKSFATNLTSQFTTFSGFIGVLLPDVSWPTFELKYRINGSGGDTCIVRRARMFLRRL